MSAGEVWMPEVELHAYLDGELASDRIQEVGEYVAGDTEAAARLQRYRDQNDAIRRLYGPLLQRTIPDHLLPMLPDTVGRPTRSRSARPLRALAALLACLILGAAGGWLAATQLGAERTSAPRFITDAFDAHQIYVSEFRHPVEVPASQEQHLTTWLSDRLDLRFAAPNLTPDGFDLLGGRLLPAAIGPAAQLMYESADGQRLTLYVRASNEPKTTSFRFTKEDPIAALDWREHGAAWALLGELSRAELLRLAEKVYRALNS